VRACDAMLKNIIAAYNDEKIGFKKCKSYPEGIDLSLAHNFLLVTDNDFICETHLLEEKDIRKGLLNDLFTRKLFKRILKISYQTVTSEAERGNSTSVEEIKAQLSEFNNLRYNSEIKDQLIADILSMAKIASLNKYEVAIDIPHRPNFDKAGIASINISSSENKPKIVKLKEIIPIDDWITGYETFFSNAYLFGPSDIDKRVALAIATAKVLSEENIAGIYLQFTVEAIAEDIRDLVLNKENELKLSLFKQ
jgi:hypothetical protein